MRLRFIELFVLFALLPMLLLGLKASGIRVAPLPILWLAMIGCLVLLWRGGKSPAATPVGERSRKNRSHALIEVVITVVVGSLLLLILYQAISDQPMFVFPRRNPGIWLIVLVLYPVLSVVPQGIVFRRWFVWRYRSILGTGTLMILVGAVCFGCSHILFGNVVAPLLTCIGGVFFMRTYLRSGSGWLADLQHALLGDIAFTIGYGQWLYAGPIN
ncbi:MAG: hypothetical protein CBC35_00890 [Planctomycetes bacterium TMED75]|nr:hypothetical protein [Planctomycetaceae bacterium]OUU96562.1 MAG: hypothetical protein CBC35_00890 [Planctomycetes bacterium TMED75]